MPRPKAAPDETTDDDRLAALERQVAGLRAATTARQRSALRPPMMSSESRERSDREEARMKAAQTALVEAQERESQQRERDAPAWAKANAAMEAVSDTIASVEREYEQRRAELETDCRAARQEIARLEQRAAAAANHPPEAQSVFARIADVRDMTGRRQ